MIIYLAPAWVTISSNTREKVALHKGKPRCLVTGAVLHSRCCSSQQRVCSTIAKCAGKGLCFPQHKLPPASISVR